MRDMGDTTKCANCQSSFYPETYHSPEGTIIARFELYRSDCDITELLCSPACLCEYAWKLREQMPKLSKSSNR